MNVSRGLLLLHLFITAVLAGPARDNEVSQPETRGEDSLGESLVFEQETSGPAEGPPGQGESGLVEGSGGVRTREVRQTRRDNRWKLIHGSESK